jgi:hypothetical protein
MRLRSVASLTSKHRRECNSLLQAADEAVFGDHAEFYRENSNDWFDG